MSEVVDAIRQKAEEICGYYPDAKSFAVYMNQSVRELIEIDDITLKDGRKLPIVVNDTLRERENSDGTFSSEILICSPELLKDWSGL